MSDLDARETSERTSKPAQGDAEPAAIVPPERKGRQDLIVVRQLGETDADFEARCSFMALLLDAVEK
jgi:hypothetical protein